MKIFVGILLIATFVACSSAASLPELIDDSSSEMIPIEGESSIDESNDNQNSAFSPSHSRQRRFTCDAFSFSSKWVTPNHSACALKCVGKGRKGGHCVNNNCVCRDDRYIG